MSLKTTIIPLTIILVITFVLYTYKLARIPTNITGDENTFLVSVYKILFSDEFVNPAVLSGDGTQSALNFYFMAILIKSVGLENTVFGMRLTTVLFSIGTLIVFYFLLKERVSPAVSLIITLMMSTSIWYINFSRNGWFHLGAVFFGITMIYFLEKATKGNENRYYILAGLFSGLAFYSYFIGKVYLIAAIMYLCMKLPTTISKRSLYSYSLFIFTAFVVILPLLISVSNNKDIFLSRPQSVFILRPLLQTNPLDYGGIVQILNTQLIDNIKGLLLIDGSVIGKGVENLRYFPYQTQVVDTMIKSIFLIGIILVFFSRVDLILWWLVYLLTMLVLIFTTDTPNLNRAIPILPFIYLLSAFTIQKLLNLARVGIVSTVLIFVIISLGITVSIYNIHNYFAWIQSLQTVQARQPAIDYNEFYPWQDYQINKVKNGQIPITNYEWYKIRGSVINSYVK